MLITVYVLLVKLSSFLSKNIYVHQHFGASGGAYGWSTARQAGRSRVRFPIVSWTIISAALWSWGRLRLKQKCVPGIFPWGKGGLRVQLTTLPPSCAYSHKIWEPEPPGTLRACKASTGTALLLLCRRAVADLLLRPRGHWDRHFHLIN